MTMASGADSSRPRKWASLRRIACSSWFRWTATAIDIRDRLEKVDVLLGEIPLRRAIGAQKAERTNAARNNHGEAANDCMVNQVRRYRERQILTQVVDHHAAFAFQSVTGLRIWGPPERSPCRRNLASSQVRRA